MTLGCISWPLTGGNGFFIYILATGKDKDTTEANPRHSMAIAVSWNLTDQLQQATFGTAPSPPRASLCPCPRSACASPPSQHTTPQTWNCPDLPAPEERLPEREKQEPILSPFPKTKTLHQYRHYSKMGESRPGKLPRSSPLLDPQAEAVRPKEGGAKGPSGCPGASIDQPKGPTSCSNFFCSRT